MPRLKGTKETNGEFASPLNIHPLWPSDFILYMYHKMIIGLGNGLSPAQYQPIT